jgi:hypothetical protein
MYRIRASFERTAGERASARGAGNAPLAEARGSGLRRFGKASARGGEGSPRLALHALQAAPPRCPGLGRLGGGALNLAIAAAANPEVVRPERKAMRALNREDEIEDILITLGQPYHLMRPLRARPPVFFYVALDRRRANLAMARFTLADGGRDLTL